MKHNPDHVVLCLPRRACSRIVLCGAIILTILIPSVPLRAQAQSHITQASVSGTAVSIQGVNLGTAVTAITLGTTTVLNPFVNPTGDLVTGTLASPLTPGTYLLSVISTSSNNSASCTSPQPSPDFVCVSGGWVPSNHPLAIPSVQALTFLVTVGGSGPEGPVRAPAPWHRSRPAGPAGLAGRRVDRPVPQAASRRSEWPDGFDWTRRSRRTTGSRRSTGCGRTGGNSRRHRPCRSGRSTGPHRAVGRRRHDRQRRQQRHAGPHRQRHSKRRTSNYVDGLPRGHQLGRHVSSCPDLLYGRRLYRNRHPEFGGP